MKPATCSRAIRYSGRLAELDASAGDDAAALARLADVAEIAAAMGLAPEVRRIAEATAR